MLKAPAYSALLGYSHYQVIRDVQISPERYVQVSSTDRNHSRRNKRAPRSKTTSPLKDPAPGSEEGDPGSEEGDSVGVWWSTGHKAPRQRWRWEDRPLS
eukprot:728452-Pyramimonas_sp.AAC.1